MSSRDEPTGRQVQYLRILGKRVSEYIGSEYEAPFASTWQNGPRLLRGDASQLIEVLTAVADKLSSVDDSVTLEPEFESEPEPRDWTQEREPEVPKGNRYIKVYRKFYHEKQLVPDYHMSNGYQLVERQPGWVWECHHPSHKKRLVRGAQKDTIIRGRAQAGRLKTTNNALQHWVIYHTGERGEEK